MRRLLDISMEENEEFAFLVMEYFPTDLEKELKSLRKSGK